MPHFVTSAQGKAHVTSANAAHLTAGLLGNGCYVLPIGQKLACTMTDSNTLRVLFGVASVCGRQWEIEGDYEEVNIDNGVPGYNRTDLLVCRIETAPQETIELKVYKGEETTGTPVVPGHVEGDLNDGDTVCEMPICSVRVNGINPQAPVMLAEESIDIMALVQDLRDYKSQNDEAVSSAASAASAAKSAAATAQTTADSAKSAAAALKPLYTIHDISVAWTCASGSTSPASFAAPSKAGYDYIGPVYAYSGVGGVDIVAMHTSELTVRNHRSSSASGTAKARLLYIRS